MARVAVRQGRVDLAQVRQQADVGDDIWVVLPKGDAVVIEFQLCDEPARSEVKGQPFGWLSVPQLMGMMRCPDAFGAMMP